MKRAILLLTWEYPPHIVGGLGRHVSELAEALGRENLSVHVLTVKRQLIDKDYCIENNVVIHRVMPLMQGGSFLDWVASVNIAMEEKARDIIAQYGIALIHAHDWIVAASSIILKQQLLIPLIATIHATEAGRHNGIHTESQKFIDRQERLLMANADHLIVCSHYMRDELLHKYHQLASAVSIIFNGVSTPQKNDYYSHPNRPYLFSMGRMVGEKGFDLLISLAEKYRDSRKMVQIIVAGKGPLLSYYRQKVLAKQLGEWIQFIGFVNDDERDRWLAGADAAIFPSLYEPFGMVALEAMAAGVPVLLANIGGFMEIVQENISGVFFNPLNVEELEEKLESLLSDQTFSKQIIQEAKKRVRTTFSWHSVAKQTLIVYQNNGLGNTFQKKR